MKTKKCENRVLSVIIPIYNAERYLKDTFNSIENQTIFDKLEIILVNDGSQDNSLVLCEEFSKKHDNIVLLNQSNQGVSVARNAGLKIAKGRYITFLDADDYIEIDLYEKELKCIEETQADIFVIDFKKDFQNGKVVKYRKKKVVRQWNSNQEILCAFFAGIIGNKVTDKIFFSKILCDVNFPIGYKVGEDMYFVFSALRNCQMICMDTQIDGYHYKIRESSVMNGEFSKKFFDPYYLSEKIFEECSKTGLLKKEAYAHLIHETCKVLEYAYRHKSVDLYQKEIDEMKKIIKTYSIKEAKKYLIARQFLGFFLMRISPKLYLIMHRIMRIG